MTDIEISPTKLTRWLKVKEKRPDGYHVIKSEMVTLKYCDTLEISKGSGVTFRSDILSEEAIEVLNNLLDSNLIAKALKLIGLDRKVLVDKKIPPGGGLGGGSSNAAAILRWFIKTRHVSHESSSFKNILIGALNLGSDIPFLVYGGRAVVGGIGEVVNPLPFLKLNILLVISELVVSTKAVYEEFDRIKDEDVNVGSGSRSKLQKSDRMGIDNIETSNVTSEGNDLEPAAFRVERRLVELRDFISEQTGYVPKLAGSGSTFYFEESDIDPSIMGKLDHKNVHLKFKDGSTSMVSFIKTSTRQSDLS